MPSYPYWLLVALQALISAAAPSSGTCNSDGEQNVTVDGWPVLVAMRLPGMAKVTMHLSLSQGHMAHTNLSLVTSNGLLRVKMRSKMLSRDMEMATLVHDSEWTTLRIASRTSELELRAESETRFDKYSASTLVNSTHHLPVNSVSCYGSKCAPYIDLKCRYSKSDNTQKLKPRSSISTKTKSHQGVHLWIYVLVTLFVLVCLLFLVWQNEHKKLKTRWLSHRQAVNEVTTLDEDKDISQAEVDVRKGIVEWRVVTNGGVTNLAYDKSGDSDSTIG